MRQYIGARYVPTFADPLTWDNSHSYEALIMVDYMGDTYTSKKPVPPGVAITNTDYWVMTGSFNSQLNELRQEIAELTRPRRFIYLGDSYNNIVPGTEWTEIVDTALGLTDSVKITVGGSGFIATVHTWLDLLQAQVIDDDDSITDILIVGGANDSFKTLSDLIPAMTTFDTYIKTRFANLKNVYVGFAGNSFYSSAQSVNMRLFSNEYQKGAAALNWIYLNGIEQTLYNPVLVQKIGADDELHPNQDGVKKLGKNIVACLNSGSCNNRSSLTCTITTDTAHWAERTFDITESITDNILTVSWSDFSIQANTDTTGYIKIGSCPDLRNAILPGTVLPLNYKYNGTYYYTILAFASNGIDLYASIPITIANGGYMDFRGTTLTFDLSK